MVLQRKCDKYWPMLGTEEQHGDLRVTNISEFDNELYTMRQFKLYNNKTQKENLVFQYQYKVSC